MHNAAHKNAWPVNVVIMAGGKGTRLKDLTIDTPKVLIDVNGKPVIHHLIQHVASFGISSVYISVGHFADQIITSLSDGGDFGICIKYIREDRAMGSIGALTLDVDWEYDDFLVINGDIFTNFNPEELLSRFFSKNADLAILTLREALEIPWGVLKVDLGGDIIQLVEKPKYEFDISAGVYAFNAKILKLLPFLTPIEGWEMIKLAINSGYKIISAPITNGFWVDIGTPETLSKARQLTTVKSNFKEN